MKFIDSLAQKVAERLIANETFAKAVLTLALKESKNREFILTALTCDYGLIQHILDNAQEGDYVEFKNPNGTVTTIGKSINKGPPSQVGKYY